MPPNAAKKKKKILGFAEQSLSQLVNATKIAIDDPTRMGVTVFQYSLKKKQTEVGTSRKLKVG